MHENPSSPYAADYPILVTGGSGLVGSELIGQLLKAGRKVTAIYHNTPLSIYKDHPNVFLVQADILDTYRLEEILKGVSHVYHCAALVSFNPNDQADLFRTNIEGTTSVVNACITAGVKKLLFVSSVSAMGRIREDEMVDEKMYWTEKTSNSIYGKSKYLAEMEVWRGTGEGLDAIIVNPTIILGSHSWENGSSAIFKTVYNEFPWYTEGVSGFVSVKDVCRAMILLMHSDITNERFILNGLNTSYKNIFTLIANEFSKKPPHKKVSKFLSEIIWRTENIKSHFTHKKPFLTKETSHTAQAKVYFDNSKIKKYLPGFQFEPIEVTIHETCNSLKAKYNL